MRRSFVSRTSFEVRFLLIQGSRQVVAAYHQAWFISNPGQAASELEALQGFPFEPMALRFNFPVLQASFVQPNERWDEVRARSLTHSQDLERADFLQNQARVLNLLRMPYERSPRLSAARLRLHGNPLQGSRAATADLR